MSWFPAYSTPTQLLRVLTTLLAAGSVPLSSMAQQQAIGPVASQPGPKKAKHAEKTAPVTVQSEQVGGRAELDIKLTGQVELTRDQTRITSEHAEYFPVEDRVEAKSSVQMWRFGDYYTGDELKLTLDSGQGSILNPTYKLVENRAQGSAKRVDFVNENEATVVEGTYSTCEGPNPDWYLKVDTLNIDTGRDVGEAGKTVIFFKGVPILGAPSMSFPLSSTRRSGLLPPTIGATSTGGGELTLPYYFNIAPNRDLTLYPKFISRRGLQLGANARYLGETYLGETNLEFLPSDRVARRNRYAFSTLYRQSFGPNWSTSLNLNHASDDDYPRDFANSLATSTRRQLIREWRTDYTTPGWSAGFRVQNYQILQDPAALLDPTLKVERPYDRLPQLVWHAGRRDLSGFDWAVDSELTRFWHPDKVRAVRAVVNPQVSFSFIRNAFFVTPKLSLHASKYQLDGPVNPLDPGVTSYTRSLPTASVNAGVVFERDTSLFGRAMTQTLEPRLFYVNTPFRDQSKIPLFDTAETSFNFTQLFNENRFTGQDRISDANHVTFGLVSRFIESSGVERLRLGFGERFYIRQQRVLLDTTSVQTRDTRSDLLFSASGRISPVWAIDSSVQYNERSRSTVASNFGIQWKPGEKKVLNTEYRYLRNNSGGVANNGFEQLNISGQWPFAQRYYAVGRISYSLPERRTTESLAGFEYNADCWVLRAVVQRFATATLKANTTFFLQLELNGLSKLGPNPLEALSKNIPGYQKVNQTDGPNL
jgi:LPS-assembly protein